MTVWKSLITRRSNCYIVSFHILLVGWGIEFKKTVERIVLCIKKLSWRTITEKWFDLTMKFSILDITSFPQQLWYVNDVTVLVVIHHWRELYWSSAFELEIVVTSAWRRKIKNVYGSNKSFFCSTKRISHAIKIQEQE